MRPPLIALALSLLSGPLMAQAADPPLRVVATVGNPQEWEVARRAFDLIMRKSELAYSLSQEPHDRAVHSLKQGQYDMDAGRVPGFDQVVPGMLRVDPPLLMLTSRIYGRQIPPTLQSWAELANYSIAYIRGQRAVQFKLLPTQAATPVVTAAACLGMASAGRVDFCVVASMVEQSLGGENAVLQSRAIDRTALHIWVGPGREPLARRLGVALRNLSDSGELERVVREAVVP